MSKGKLYTYAQGDPGFEIALTGNDDVLEFGKGIDPYDVSQWLVYPGTVPGERIMEIHIDEKVITVNGVMDGCMFKSIIFEDGTRWAVDEILEHCSMGTMGSDIIDGTDKKKIIAGKGDDLIKIGDATEVFAGDGNDTLWGGNDRMFQTLYAGNGDDLIYSWSESGKAVQHQEIFLGEGSDTYVYRQGVREYEASVTLHQAGEDDYIAFEEGVEAKDVLVRKTARGWVIGVKAGDVHYSNGYTYILKPDTDEADFKGPQLKFVDGTTARLEDYILKTQYGLENRDVFLGNNKPNFYDGLGGDDIINGNRGDDVLWGNDGNDVMSGQAGWDQLNGGAGDDVMNGGSGSDEIFGDAGKDMIHGGRGNDEVYGGSDDDMIFGDSGRDIIEGGLGSDYIRGGSGDDKIYGYKEPLWMSGMDLNGHDNLMGGRGNDFISAEHSGSSSLYGDTGNDTLRGSDFKDYLSGGSGNDQLWGLRGNDLLVGGKGDDTLYGGAGNDTYRFAGNFGHDTVINKAETTEENDRIEIETKYTNLVMQSTEKDLVIKVIGSDNDITIRSWNTSDKAKVDVVSAKGVYIEQAKVQQLIQSMAEFSKDTGIGWEQAMVEQNKQALDIIASYYSTDM